MCKWSEVWFKIGNHVIWLSLILITQNNVYIFKLEIPCFKKEDQHIPMLVDSCVFRTIFISVSMVTICYIVMARFLWLLHCYDKSVSMVTAYYFGMTRYHWLLHCYSKAVSMVITLL